MGSISDVRACAMELERVDTHQHLPPTLSFEDLHDQAERFAALRSCLAVITSRALAAGCRKLYGPDAGAYLRPDSPPEIFQQARQLRQRGFVPALHHALDACGITTQLIFTTHHPQRDPRYQISPRLRPIAYVDEALYGDVNAFTPDGTANKSFCHYEALCADLGPLGGLQDYLDRLDEVIDGWRGCGVVAMKTSLAYMTGLEISDPSPAEARSAFARKGDMTPTDSRLVVDFVFRHALLACLRNELPVIFHTGFQVWGHRSLAQSNPMLLHNLLVDPRYRGLTFVLLHGGFPYVGETTYLAAMFPSVILDFTFLSWGAPARFRLALQEWLECVPPSKMCWGSDSCDPESMAGIDAITRREIAGVLEGMLADGRLDERAALAFLQSCYQDTPRRVFGL